MILLETEKMALDVREGSFCIYDKETFHAISSGYVDGLAFGGCHEKMTKWAKDKFEQLKDQNNDK